LVLSPLFPNEECFGTHRESFFRKQGPSFVAMPGFLKIDRANVQRWVLPGLALATLVITLLYFFAFGSDESQTRFSLGTSLWTIWTSSGALSEEYSYCLLVPFIVAYLVWNKRSLLAATPVEHDRAGLGWTLLGLLLFWLGARAGKQYIGFAGIQAVLAGGIIWFWGVRIFRVLIFPWAMVGFIWPLLILDSLVAFPLRLHVSRLCYHALNLAGIPCIESGTALFSAPNPAANLALGDRFKIDIADPCSGMHSLLALLMLSALYAYFCLPRRWQQWTVFFSAIPLAVFGNMVRIFMLVAGSLAWGSSVAVGTDENPSLYHETAGFAVIAIVLVMEYLLGTLLMAVEKKRGRAGTSRESARLSPPAAPFPAGQRKMPSPWCSAVFFGLALLMVLIDQIVPPLALVPQSGVAMELPGEVRMAGTDEGKFYGFPAAVTEVERSLLPKDTEFARNNYTDFRGHSIFFSIVLSGVQQFTIHRPEICLVGQGWVIDGSQDVPVALDSGHTLVARNLLLHRLVIDPQGQSHVLQAYHMYWYVTDGIVTPSYIGRDWSTVWDRVFHNRDHRWAYVAVMSAITKSQRSDGLDGEQTIAMLAEFIRRIVPSVQKSEMPAGGLNAAPAL
jgi:exosortase